MAPNTCGSARSKHGVAQSRCAAVAVRSMREAAQSTRAAAEIQNIRRAVARSYKDVPKMHHADCTRRPDLRKAAGWCCSEAHPVS